MKKSLLLKVLFLILFIPNLGFSQDTDGDGVPDSSDIDDDNDGIIDTLECQNLLVDSGFDNKTGLNYGNNIGVNILPWVLGSGNQANIVKVDGFGGYNYGNGGPFEDANPSTGAGEDQHYLDIASGSNDFYQSVVLSHGAKLTYGGYFSSRDGRTGNARVRIFTGSSGSSGTLIADSGSFSVSPIGGDSENTPWQYFEDVVNVPAGTYSYVVSMDNDMNFDEGFAIACLDRDGDSAYDYIDIDSDDDGIPDNIEAQPTNGYIPPSGLSGSITDANGNGLDDVYESAMGGIDLTSLVDTDNDGTYDYLDTDTDNDGKPDIQENGQPDILNNVDTDIDGLDDAFDSVLAYLDINDEVSVGDISDLVSSFGDVDLDATLGGDLDYRDLFDVNPPSSATIDFDGVDDYMDSELDLTGYSQATIMAWIKLDENFTNSGYAVNFGNLNIEAHSSRQIWMSVNGATITSHSISKDKWAHLTLVFDSNSPSEKLKGYINGVQFASSNDASLAGTISGSANKFTIGARALDYTKLFYGSIDEVRVFDVALSEDQFQKMIYQEIKNNSGNVQGTVVPKLVRDCNTSSTVAWANLRAYYPMTDIKTSQTTDYSGNGVTASLHNITTVMEQTAPMPYVTSGNGCACNESTWLHGDDWNLNSLKNTDYSIVRVNNDISTDTDLKTLGLFISSGNTLTINADNQIKNNWYLELNGTLDLMGDSQLLQTENSDLVTSADGKILRRQEGQSNPYRYNYWGSPVGTTGATTLSDNNAAGNNPNNTAFQLNMLKDGTGSGCLFTSAQTGNGKISTIWLYTYINGLTYWDWLEISPSAALSPGVGYTQKGTGNAGSEQQYIFEGKPNNGTILLNVTDKGGVGSVPNVSKTEYLLGNPYASALDVHQFIDDNVGVIDGTLHLWQQWAGSSHYLNEYQGGYAQVNKLGSCRAYQFVGFYGDHNGSQDGTIVPTRYLPVGQGFMVEIVADGQVEFNNGQRVFVKESDADGTYGNGSTFSKSATSKNSKKQSADEAMQKIRLEFSSVSGPKTRRELLMGFSSYTSDAFDYGYDAMCTDTNNNDLNLALEGKNMTMQAYGTITDDKVVPLNFKSSGDNTFEIMISEKENIKESQRIYLRDNLTGEYFELTKDGAYQFSSEAGVFNTRLEIVFQSEQQMLSAEDLYATKSYTYFQNPTKTFYAKNMDSEVTHFGVVNMRGQNVLDLNGVSNSQLEMGIRLDNLATGSYVVCLRTSNNEVLTKKIVIN